MLDSQINSLEMSDFLQTVGCETNQINEQNVL
uniref:Uncharacterized protein n=1 Tax=Arundo donax TaxID=35708 RepID=A0A0A8Y868_ARUDO